MSATNQFEPLIATRPEGGPERGSGSARNVSDHELLRCIGRGSYGEVWLARSVTGRWRAVKMVHRQKFENDRPFEREFEGIRSFEPISRLHESQLDVLHVGRNDAEGCFYYVMELADDARAAGTGAVPPPGPEFDWERYEPKTLRSELVRRGRLSVAECIEIGLALTTALEHLHSHGLVHRDVKPSNILYVNGRPKLGDIGLVSAVDETVSFVGTEGYVPPEGPGTVQADLYSLGKVLYEAATGRDREQFPELPTDVEARADETALLELNQVLLKACQREVKKRYRSAWQMHHDLLLLQTGKSLARMRKMERRLTLASRIGIAIVALAILGGWAYYVEHTAELKVRAQLIRLSLANGQKLIEQRDPFGALLWFVEAFRLDRGNAKTEPAHRLRIGSILQQSPRLEQVWVLRGQANDVDFSPDGRWVAAACGDGNAQVWDAITGQAVTPRLRHEAMVEEARFLPDGKRLVTCSRDGTARFWELPSGKPVGQPLEHPWPVWLIVLSKDGRYLVTITAERGNQGAGEAWLWDTETGKLRYKFTHGERTRCAGFSPDGRLLATCGSDKTARVFDLEDYRPIAPAMMHPAEVRHVAFSPDGKRLLTFCRSVGGARVWDVATGEALTPPLHADEYLRSATFSNDGEYVATSGNGRLVRIWKAGSGEPAFKPLVHDNRVDFAGFGADRNLLITYGSEALVRFWDFQSGSSLPWITLHNSSTIQQLNLSPSGDAVAIACRDGVVRLWKLRGFEPDLVLNTSGPIQGCAFGPASAGGETVVTFGGNVAQVHNLTTGRIERQFSAGPPRAGAVMWLAGFRHNAEGFLTVQSFTCPTNEMLLDWESRIWEAAGGQEMGLPLRFQTERSAYVQAGVFERDHIRLLVGVENELRVLDPLTGKHVTPVLQHDGRVEEARFSPDGQKLATRTRHNHLDLWDLSTGKRIGASITLAYLGTALAFSQDGTRLAAGLLDGSLELFDAKNGKRIASVGKHLRPIRSVFLYSKSIIAMSDDGMIGHWDSRTGQPLIPMIEGLNPEAPPSLSADGALLFAVGKNDRMVSIWDLSTGLYAAGGFASPVLPKAGQISANGKHLLLWCSDDKIRLWHLSREERSLEVLTSLAGLLSGQVLDENGSLVPLDVQCTAKRWLDLYSREKSN